MADPIRVGRFGNGQCITHHGELFQGALRRDGCITPCLVSLPRHDTVSNCRLELFAAQALEVVPGWKWKALRAARLTLERCGLQDATGRLTLTSHVDPGLGLGSSTADVVAAVRAVADITREHLSADDVAAIAVDAEMAVDPLMYEHFGLLFAQRAGKVLESWGNWYPDYAVFSVNLGAAGARIDTLSLPPPRYSDFELEEYDRLVAALSGGFRRQDSAAIAAVASRSAMLNQSRVPLLHFAAVAEMVGNTGALGIQITHSGVMGGVLFDPEDPLLNAKVAALAAQWRKVGDGVFELFETTRSV